MGGYQWRGRLGPAVAVAPGAQVERFEIFFDLVFVVSFFLIIRTTAANVTGSQILHAGLVLAVLWWCWVVHSVLATQVRLGEGFVPVVMVIAMAALFGFAVALPQVFDDPHPGGGLLVTGSYLTMRAVHLLVPLFALRGESSRPLRLPQLLEVVVTTLLLLAAALLPTRIDDAGLAALVRDGLWAIVILLQYGGGLIVGPQWWRLASAEHWTERYDLILIIALGESIIAIGVGGHLLGKPATWPAVIAVFLGIVSIAALWWTHFDLIGPAARITMHAVESRRQVTMARDAYAYLYLPMVAGVIAFAIGAEGTVREITEPGGGAGQPATDSNVPMLFGGTMLYLAANLAFQLRTLGTILWTRVAVLFVLAGGLLVGRQLPALGALGLLTAICLALVTVEVVLFADSRHALRRAMHEERMSLEAAGVASRARWRAQDSMPDEQNGGPGAQEGGPAAQRSGPGEHDGGPGEHDGGPDEPNR